MGYASLLVGPLPIGSVRAGRIEKWALGVNEVYHIARRGPRGF